MTTPARLHDEIDQDEEMMQLARETMATAAKRETAALLDALNRKRSGEDVDLPSPRAVMARIVAAQTEALTDLSTEAVRAGAARVVKR